MPEVFPNNTFWRRGGRLNQKLHVDMTEEEKAHVSRCTGIKAEHPCKNLVFRCTKCGNYGCTHELADKCTEQGFKGDKCLNCGSTGTMIPVLENELAAFIAEWEKEIEVIEDK